MSLASENTEEGQDSLVTVPKSFPPLFWVLSITGIQLSKKLPDGQWVVNKKTMTMNILQIIYMLTLFILMGSLLTLSNICVTD